MNDNTSGANQSASPIGIHYVDVHKNNETRICECYLNTWQYYISVIKSPNYACSSRTIVIVVAIILSITQLLYVTTIQKNIEKAIKVDSLTEGEWYFNHTSVYWNEYTLEYFYTSGDTRGESDYYNSTICDEDQDWCSTMIQSGIVCITECIN